uniref:Uma2 family endonuclease n=1 Tax=Cohnella sp. TaxID=1883426 RepID=UPI0035651D86
MTEKRNDGTQGKDKQEIAGQGKVKVKVKVKETPENYLIDERYEIIEGVRYDFLSSPVYAHQQVLRELYAAFRNDCLAEGKVLFAPLDVHFDEDNIFQPDLIYIVNANRGIIRDGYIYGAPDLVVEILSASTGRRDKTIKKNGYEKFGVREYWIVDLAHRLVEQFVLVDGKYAAVATLTEEQTLTSPTVPCLHLNLGDILREEEGNDESEAKDKQGKVKETPKNYLIDERYEIIEGVRYDFLSSPVYAHQQVLRDLILGFHQNCAKDGEVLFAPLDVHFDEDNIFQPDLIYIANANRGIIRDGYIYGAPDLVVEILSASTGRRDKTIKKNGYEKFGVREYWL